MNLVFIDSLARSIIFSIENKFVLIMENIASMHLTCKKWILAGFYL